MIIKDFKESYNYYQHGKGAAPNTNTIGGAWGRATAGLFRMTICKIFNKLADRDEGLAISVAEMYMNILFRFIGIWIIVSIIACSPDLFDQKFEKIGVLGCFLVFFWACNFADNMDIKEYDKGNYEYYKRSMKERVLELGKWSIYFLIMLGVCNLIFSFLVK